MVEKYIAALKNVFIVYLLIFSVGVVSYHIKDSSIFKRDSAAPQPEEHQLYIHNGMEMVRQEKYDEGIEWYTKAIESKPDDGLSYFCMANAYRLKNEPQYAIDYFKKSIRLEPGNNMSYYLLGVSYCSLGDKEKALEIYDFLKDKDYKLAERLIFIIKG